MLFTNIAYSVVFNRCPQCHKGKVLKYPPYQLGKLLDTEDLCSHCNLKYEKEPGFFYGAMYVSYALSSGIFIVAYLLQSLFFNFPITQFAIFMVSLMLLAFPIIARWSRILWLNFFVKFDPAKSTNQII
ncbi:MAG TPA: DUF983 domain-containing protein [Bacteroidia bacterium]|nr:DUF983 domain-containing protein [Bacteroidia bacterium]